MLGGAFNPPHVGHLALARAARSELGLERVLLVPTGQAPHKEIEDDPGPEVRLRMVELAARGEEGIDASALEVERDEPSHTPTYTYRTVELLREKEPDRALTFLMGADVAAGLAAWKKPERIVELARLGIAERPGVERGEVEEVVEQLGAADRVDWIAMPRCEASSTKARQLAAAGESLEELVPAAVAQLIEREGIYR